jgi:hypothetical protein
LEVDVIEQHRVHVLLAREVEEHPDREIADLQRLSRLISLTARSCGQNITLCDGPGNLR